MGAELWYHEAPWHSNPSEALRALQTQFLAENYNLTKVLPQHLKWARESLAAAQADDDRYGLVDLYSEKVQLLERLNSEPIPADPAAQIEILRQIYADSGQGISNVLDVTGVSSQRSFFTARPLAPVEIMHFTGAAQPSISEAREALDKINEALGRGECVCFPVYEDDRKTPVGWFFVGNTVD